MASNNPDIAGWVAASIMRAMSLTTVIQRCSRSSLLPWSLRRLGLFHTTNGKFCLRSCNYSCSRHKMCIYIIYIYYLHKYIYTIYIYYLSIYIIYIYMIYIYIYYLYIYILSIYVYDLYIYYLYIYIIYIYIIYIYIIYMNYQ